MAFAPNRQMFKRDADFKSQRTDSPTKQKSYASGAEDTLHQSLRPKSAAATVTSLISYEKSVILSVTQTRGGRAPLEASQPKREEVWEAFQLRAG
jgi:hypothetical protein